MLPQKEEVMKRVEEYVTQYISQNPEDNIPEILNRRTQATNTLVSNTPTINTWATRFQSSYADKRVIQLETKAAKQSNVPEPLVILIQQQEFKFIPRTHHTHRRIQP